MAREYASLDVGRLQPALNPPLLTSFNLGVQLLWGAILAVSLQARAVELQPGYEIQAYAGIAAVGAAIAAVVQLVAGRAADWRAARCGHRREFYVAGALLTLPLLFWFYLAPNFTQFAAAFFGLQFSVNLAGGPYQAAIPDHTPPQRQGETASWMSIWQSLGAAAGLVIAGFVASATATATLLAAGFMASFAPMYLHLRGLPISAISDVAAAPRPPGPLIVLLISRALMNSGFYLLMGFLLFFIRDSLQIRDAAASRMDTALLFLSFTIAGIGGAVLSARPADRYDKRAVITAASGLMICALLMLATATALPFAFPAAVLAGVAWGAFLTTDWALACTVLPKPSIATAMGVWNLASVIPQVIAPLLAAPLVLAANSMHMGLGPRAAIIAATITYALGTGLIWRIPKAYASSDFA